MKKLLFIFIVLILMLIKTLLPITSVPLEKLSRPSMFIINNEKIYILEKATVFIYSFKDFKLIKEFGKAGEGPKEFRYDGRNGRPLSMVFYKNELMVNSEFKISYFDSYGNYKREEKVPVDRLLFPIKDKYLGIGMIPGENNRQYLGFTLHDKDFKSEKKIFLSKFEMNNPRKIVLPITSFTYNPVYKGNIYINASSERFNIKILNENGKKVRIIEKQYPPKKIPESFKTEALAFFKKSPQFKRAYEFIKKVLKIREYYPPIRDIQISDDFIYIITFKRKGDLWECIKMDLMGNEKGSAFIPLNQYEHLSFYPILYSVYKGKIYTLVEDEEDEIWKIHKTEFK